MDNTSKAEYWFPEMSWYKQLWGYRELVQILVIRDLKVRYKRSVLGFFWTLLNPLITILIFLMVFSRIFTNFYEHYKLYMISGVLIWNFFTMATTQGLTSVVANAGTLRKMAIPKFIFPVTVVCSNFINFIFSMVALAAVYPFLGGRLNPSLLWIPIVLPFLFAFTLGLSLILSALTVFARDLRNIWDPVSMIWFFLTPVFYPRTVIPEKYASLLRFNPMLSIIEACRVPLYAAASPSAGLLIKAALAAILTLTIGIFIFDRLQDRFVYHL